jgi:hypothetical protein
MLILFANKIKFLAVPEVRPKMISISSEKYKGCLKFTKGNNFPTRYLIFVFINNLLAKIGWRGVIDEVQTVV